MKVMLFYVTDFDDRNGIEETITHTLEVVAIGPDAGAYVAAKDEYAKRWKHELGICGRRVDSKGFTV